MLRLIQLIACEKIIIDTNGGTASAIGMFETLNITVPKDAPTRVLFPLRWSVVGLWKREGEFEEPTKFVQRIIIRSPENEEAFTAESEFIALNEHYNFRNVINFNGFPVSTTGTVEVEIYLKQENQDEWVKHFSYPVNVIRTVEDNSDATEANSENTNIIENQNNNN